MSTENQNARNTLTMLIRNLVEAAVEDDNSGCGHPEDIPGIEADLRQAEMDLREFLNEVLPGTKREDGRPY